MSADAGSTWEPRDRRQRERRVADRRRRTAAVAVDRRRGPDRRARTRRSGDDRRQRLKRDWRLTERRLTPLPYSRDEAKTIRERVQQSEEPGACPACGGGFTVGPPISRSGRTVREYRCRDCRRAVMIPVNT